MNEDRIAAMPQPPYYAVIFAAQRAESSPDDGYRATSERMLELARARDGFLGVESTCDGSGFGISVSYWRDEAAIAEWKKDLEHREAQRRGFDDFYERFALRVARVERQSRFGRGEKRAPIPSRAQ